MTAPELLNVDLHFPRFLILTLNKTNAFKWSKAEPPSSYRVVTFLFARTLPGKHLDKIAEQMRMHNINALLVIGGFEVRKHSGKVESSEHVFSLNNIQ